MREYVINLNTKRDGLLVFVETATDALEAIESFCYSVVLDADTVVTSITVKENV